MKARLLLLLVCVVSTAAQAGGDHTRTLAASCAACHGTNGNSVGGTPVLAGLDRAYFVTQMQAFRGGGRTSTVMHHHAKGLTEEEIGLLAGYFSAQPRTAASSPLPLKDIE
jgi:cytochrome subunit of sulfide dehydrogenase